MPDAKSFSGNEFFLRVRDILREANSDELRMVMDDEAGHLVPALAVDWLSSGVTGGNCWGGSANMSVDPDEPKDIAGLCLILNALAPDTGYQTYLRALSMTRTRHYEVREYYGNMNVFTTRYLPLEQMFDVLECDGILRRHDADSRCDDAVSSFMDSMAARYQDHLSGKERKHRLPDLLAVDRPANELERTRYGAGHLKGFILEGPRPYQMKDAMTAFFEVVLDDNSRSKSTWGVWSACQSDSLSLSNLPRGPSVWDGGGPLYLDAGDLWKTSVLLGWAPAPRLDLDHDEPEVDAPRPRP